MAIRSKSHLVAITDWKITFMTKYHITLVCVNHQNLSLLVITCKRLYQIGFNVYWELAKAFHSTPAKKTIAKVLYKVRVGYMMSVSHLRLISPKSCLVYKSSFCFGLSVHLTSTPANWSVCYIIKW